MAAATKIDGGSGVAEYGGGCTALLASMKMLLERGGSVCAYAACRCRWRALVDLCWCSRMAMGATNQRCAAVGAGGNSSERMNCVAYLSAQRQQGGRCDDGEFVNWCWRGWLLIMMVVLIL